MIKYAFLLATLCSFLVKENNVELDSEKYDNHHIEILDNDNDYYDCYGDDTEYGAKMIVEDNYYETGSYDSNLHGSIGYTDYDDYAYFKTLTVSSFYVDFYILPSNLYVASDYYNKVSILIYDLFDPTVFYEIDNFSLSVFDIKPSTYIIKISQKIGYEFQTVIDYRLELSVVKSNANYMDGNIRDLSFNKGLGGALWVSDYNFGQFDSFLNFTSSRVYDSNLSNNIESTLDDLITISGGDKLHESSLYLWDDDLKLVLKNTCFVLMNELINEQMITTNVNYHWEQVNNGIKAVFEAFNTGLPIAAAMFNLTIPTSPLFGISSSIIESIITNFILGQQTSILPLANRYSFISNLYNCLDSSNDVVCINSFYKIEKSNGDYYVNRTLEMNDISSAVFLYHSMPNYVQPPASTDDNDYNIIYSNINFQNTDSNKLTIGYRMYGSDYDSYGFDYCNYVRGKLYGFEGNGFNNLSLINTYSNIPHGYGDLSLNTEVNVGNFSNGEYVLKRFIAPSTSNYYIQINSYSSVPLVVDIFSTIDLGYDETHLISSFNSSNGRIIIGAVYQSYCTHFMYSNSTIYLRIHSENFSANSNNYGITVLNQEPSGPHTHMYSVTTHNNRYHKYICSCGDYYFEAHQVTEFSNVCVVCGARVSGGLIHGIGDDYQEYEDNEQIVWYDNKSLVFEVKSKKEEEN